MILTKTIFFLKINFLKITASVKTSSVITKFNLQFLLFSFSPRSLVKYLEQSGVERMSDDKIG